MSILTQSFFALVSRHLVSFVFFSVRHDTKIFNYLTFCLTSVEKDEDEMTGLIRMKSFVWSFWMTAIIFALGVVFLYDTSFLFFSFAAIFLVFLLFIVKFNVEMCKVRRESK